MADIEALLAEANRVWAKAQLVSEEPSWEGEPAARALVERVATIPQCYDGLLTLLTSPSQLVVAHALQALNLMNSAVLAELPDALCGRREQVTFRCGSFRKSMDLGGFARQIRKRARKAKLGGAPESGVGGIE